VSSENTTFTIGRLAERTGVPATALRYYDELGLVRPLTRVAGRRCYDEAAVAKVGVILVLREVGFTLAEIAELMTGDHWHDLAIRKIEQLDGLAACIQVARTGLEHALACPQGDPAACPTFWSIVAARLHGRPLADPH
jgi:DNA-binding transcriptional MerR regulator